MRFEWDEAKNRLNLERHKIRFETAILVFDDLHAVTIPDRLHDEEGGRAVCHPGTAGGELRFVCRQHRKRSRWRRSDSDHFCAESDTE
jgi:uncharacterized DUF497 family protein